MANNEELLRLIESELVENTEGDILAVDMHLILATIIDNTNNGYKYMGLIPSLTLIPTSNSDGNIFYIATLPGEYINFSRVELPAHSIGIVYNTTTGWDLDVITTFKTVDNESILGNGNIAPQIDDIIFNTSSDPTINKIGGISSGSNLDGISVNNMFGDMFYRSNS